LVAVLEVFIKTCSFDMFCIIFLNCIFLFCKKKAQQLKMVHKKMNDITINVEYNHNIEMKNVLFTNYEYEYEAENADLAYR
jgi:hypothetical protein